MKYALVIACIAFQSASLAAQQRVADPVPAGESARAVLTRPIYFDYGKSSLTQEAAALLDQKMAILWVNGGMRIRVSGHSDERGSEDYNLALGQRRAAAVKNYLVRRGVAARRIETTSYGEEQPADSRRTAQARARNRRGEIEILDGTTARRYDVTDGERHDDLP